MYHRLDLHSGKRESGGTLNDSIYRKNKIRLRLSDQLAEELETLEFETETLCGNTWKDLTSSLPLGFERLNDITFAGSTVYVATDAGVLVSENGEHWRAITDTAGTHTRIDHIAVDTATVYGAGDEGIYRLNNRKAREKISPEVPNSVKSLVIKNDRLYIATKQRGMFHISVEKE